MKRLIGTPHRISNHILGKVTRSQCWRWDKRKYVLVTNEPKGKGFAGVICSDSGNFSEIESGINGVKNLESLNEGDIVLMDKNGNISILHDSSSSHNTLFLTNRCNCRCVMCPQELGTDNDEYRIDLNLKLLSLIDKEPVHLGITGGEPTLQKDGLLRVISECKRRFPKTTLTLLTNGLNFNDLSYVARLADIAHPRFQIDIPLYGDTDDLHDEVVGVKAFWRLMNSFYNLALCRLQVGIRVVIHRMNYQRLPMISRFIYHNLPFVSQIAFMEMEATGLASQNLDSLWVDPFDYNASLEEAVILLTYRNLNVSIYNAQLCVLRPGLWKYARQSISDWKREYLSQCSSCPKKDECGGVFATSSRQSAHINPIS